MSFIFTDLWDADALVQESYPMGLHTYSYCHWQLHQIHNGLPRNHEFTFQNLLGLNVIKWNLATILEEATRVMI